MPGFADPSPRSGCLSFAVSVSHPRSQTSGCSETTNTSNKWNLSTYDKEGKNEGTNGSNYGCCSVTVLGCSLAVCGTSAHGIWWKALKSSILFGYSHITLTALTYDINL